MYGCDCSLVATLGANLPDRTFLLAGEVYRYGVDAYLGLLRVDASSCIPVRSVHFIVLDVLLQRLDQSIEDADEEVV